VTAAETVALIGVGITAGVVSTVASLASVVSYPALLAFGLPPLAANMTNTVALLFTGAGAAAGSRPELTGQGARVRRLGLVAALGGGAGAALLLETPASAFERAAPVLIAAASLVLLAQPGQGGPGRADGGQSGPGRADDRQSGPGRADGGQGGPGRADGGQGPLTAPGPLARRPSRERSPFLLAALFCVAVYVGYFGAAGGILLLAVLTTMLPEPLARTNAIKNAISGLANAVAAIAFAVLGQVDWAVVAPLSGGFLIGGWTGPALVRRLPGRVLRVIVGLCGLGVAVRLGLSAYR
jgi:uncharacterized protein